ncbi:MAG: AAA domain-containing protein, partial [Terrimicrobiaceae bacterium]
LQLMEPLKRIPNARVGTVDKFQGQQAPVVIYSLTTSSPEDAPRGMEFLYSLNRLNVATSRAQAVVIVVGSLVFWSPSAAVRGKCSWRMHFAGSQKWPKLSRRQCHARSAASP